MHLVRVLLALPLIGSVASLPACGDVNAVLERFANAQDATVLVGVRRYTAKLGSRFESTLERMTLAGHGRYRVELLGVNGLRPDQMDDAWHKRFDHLATRYAGSLGRRVVLERDFRVRDLDLARENYHVHIDPNQIMYLGRPALRLELVDKFRRPDSGDRPSYELTVDEATGFVVRVVEKNVEGEVVSEMAYESIDWHPDVSRFDLSAFDSVGRLKAGGKAGDPDCAVFIPAWLPSGFVAVGEVLTEIEAAGKKVRVLELVYSDGFQEIAIFENRSLEESPFNHPPGRDEPYEVRIDYFGSLALSEFSIGETFIHVESKIGPQELTTVIESVHQR